MRDRRREAMVDWIALLDDIAHLLGEPVPGNPTLREPAGPSAVASYLQFERSTVRGWLAGQVPRHHDGEWLIECWSRVTAKERCFAPMYRAALSARGSAQ